MIVTKSGGLRRPLAAVAGASHQLRAMSSGSVRVLRGDIRAGVPGAIGNTPLIRLRKLSEETGCEASGGGAPTR